MQRIYRKLLLFTSTVVFMGLAPLIIFYAMGYRVSSNPTPAVGVLLIDAIPRRANITVNGSEVGRAPRAISNLTPGQVDVAVHLDGYQPWHKQITISPAEVTEFRSLRLFPLSPARQTLLTNATNFSLSPNRRLIAALVDKSLHIIDQTGEPISRSLPLNLSVTDLQWSPDSNQLLLISAQQVSLVSLTGQIKPEVVSALSNSKSVVWDPRIPGRLLFLSPAGELIAYHTGSRTLIRLATSVANFATSSRHIYSLPANGQEIRMLNLQGILQRTIPLPAAAKKILVTPAGQIAVHYFTGRLDLLSESNSFLPVADHAKQAGFSPSGQLLYVQTDDTSLHVYNFGDERLRHLPLQQSSLVIRLSRPIRDPQWFAAGHHLIYQVDDEIIITEIDTRDRPISYTVDTTNLGASQGAVGEDGEKVFYLKNNDGQLQLVATDLVLE